MKHQQQELETTNAPFSTKKQQQHKIRAAQLQVRDIQDEESEDYKTKQLQSQQIYDKQSNLIKKGSNDTYKISNQLPDKKDKTLNASKNIISNKSKSSVFSNKCSIANSDNEDSDGQHQKNLQSNTRMIFSKEYIQRQNIQKQYLNSFLSFSMTRNQQGLLKINPQYHLHLIRTNQHLISAKMVSRNTQNTFILSKSQSDFTQNGPYYIGKIKTNFIGNQVYLFSKGYSPKKAKSNLQKRRMLATVQFKTNFFKSSRPRQFFIYFLKQGIDYYELEGTTEGSQKPLNELYQIGQNCHKIRLFRNRRPTMILEDTHQLNFYGRVKIASQKNFILQDFEGDSEIMSNHNQIQMLFGKTAKDKFVMDISEHFSYYIGFTVALSNFGNKIGCQ